MKPHTHLTGLHAAATIALVFAAFSTAHLLALSKGDTRASRALIALGW